MPIIAMPKLSDSMEEGTILTWLVDDGAAVARGDEIAEIESDKATMMFEAEFDGVMRIVADVGDTVAVGSAIAQILADGEDPAESAVTVAAPATASALVGAVASPVDGSRVGVEDLSTSHERSRIRVSPVARRMALELGIDLRQLTPTGPQERIVKRDVLAAQPESATNGSSAPQSDVPARSDRESAPTVGARGASTVEQASRLQLTVARRMAEAKATAPEFTLALDIEMDDAVELRDELKKAASNAGAAVPSLNDLVVKAVAQSLRTHPRANGSYRDGTFELFERVNVGVAVAGADALMVPVVMDADTRSLGTIAAETRRLAQAARDGALTPPELAGGTFTVSNLGMFGISHFTAILNTPQAAILAVGAVRQEPAVKDGAVVVGRRMTVTLTCDHRILYGADAASFLADVRDRLEDPLRLIL
jgi:pyruvate dehydrogenase E2 component (dihydrolipoamide acetyltransferase)